MLISQKDSYTEPKKDYSRLLCSVAGLYGTPIGDGVNTSSSQLTGTFPFLAPAYDGRDSVHAGPGQAGCTNQPGGICPVN